jgi:hypothetical protein
MCLAARPSRLSIRLCIIIIIHQSIINHHHCKFEDSFAELNHIVAAPAGGSPSFQPDRDSGKGER